MQDKTVRKYEGDYMVSMNELREKVKEEFPDFNDEQVEHLARDKRNFNKKHLDAYMKGQQIFYFGKDEFHRPIPFVVQAGYESM